MEKPYPLLIVTVTTVDGCSTDHKYPLTGTQEEMENWGQKLADTIWASMMGTRQALFLTYPSVLYKANNVVRVAYDVKGSDELMDKFSEHVRKIGFT